MFRFASMFTMALVLILCAFVDAAVGPHQTTGIKIGEVTDSSAIVWTRLTRDAKRIGDEAPLPVVTYRDPVKDKWTTKIKGKPNWDVRVQYPDNGNVQTIAGAIPGAKGEVRVLYRVKGTQVWSYTTWDRVEPEQDYIRQFLLEDLHANVHYEIQVECRKSANDPLGEKVSGTFRTAPHADQSSRIVFGVSTGQRYPDQDGSGGGFKIYPAMLELDMDFFVHTGDILYYDQLAKTLPLARWHWQRMYSLPTNVTFHKQVASYFIKDDHDTWLNDCWPSQQTKYMGAFSFAQGLAVFREQVPMGAKTYRTIRWGKDLQIWLVEGRDFRSPNTMPDGPDKTIWGLEQKQWFKRTVRESDATFKVLISPTPLVGPDRTNKKDNHANSSFKHEGDELRAFIAQQENMYVICGDRHWQYVSEDATHGVREYSCGPASDEHAGGWRNEMRRQEHKYLNVIGGFLAVTVDREKLVPTIAFRHHGVDGKVLHEDVFKLQLNDKPQTDSDRIQPYKENPSYWQYKGKPVVLLGGSADDNLFQWPDLEAHLDLMTTVGANYIRNTMSGRDNAGFEIWPYRQLENGLYDLDRWNEEYWRRFENMLKWTCERDIIVQLEIWAFHDFMTPWPTNPLNPKNNINYTADQTRLRTESYGSYWDAQHDFFYSVPKLHHDKLLLQYQQRFVDKVLSHSLSYPHVLYCMTNEIFTQYSPEWGWYWARYIKERAKQQGVTVYCAEMFQNHDLDHQQHRASFDHPEIYDFVDISQNSRQLNQTHWDKFQWVRKYLSKSPRPVNHTKTYGGPYGWWTDGPNHALERFWRNIIGGAASIRFHRPTSGIGLNQRARAHIRSARLLLAEIDIVSCIPDAESQLLSKRDPDEAYCTRINGEQYVVYFPDGGNVLLDLTNHPGTWQVNWLNIDANEWRTSWKTEVGKKIDLKPPAAGGHSLALIKKVND